MHGTQIFRPSRLAIWLSERCERGVYLLHRSQATRLLSFMALLYHRSEHLQELFKCFFGCKSSNHKELGASRRRHFGMSYRILA
jgi:hypothetical protein